MNWPLLCFAFLGAISHSVHAANEALKIRDLQGNEYSSGQTLPISTSEIGVAQVLQVSLDPEATDPVVGDVVVSLSISAGANEGEIELPVSGELVFNQSNRNTWQEIKLKGLDDSDEDGVKNFTLQLDISASDPGDAAWDALADVTLEIPNRDDESASDNSAPSTPFLRYPKNGREVTSSPTFIWEFPFDSDKDDLSYYVCVASDSLMSDSQCQEFSADEVDLSKQASTQALFLLVIVVLMGWGLQRGQRSWAWCAFVLLPMLNSCGDKKLLDSFEVQERKSIGAELVFFDDLSSGTYYWKVYADDLQGGVSESQVWSFEKP